MHSYGKHITLFIFAMCVFAEIYAQKIEVSAKFNSTVIRIGEQTQLELKAKYNKKDFKKTIRWPLIKDTLIKQVEIIAGPDTITETPDKGNPSEIIEIRTYTITSFDSGYYALAPFKFIFNDDSADFSETEALLLQVNNVKADTTLPIKDIKPPLEEPFSFEDALPYIAAIAGVAAAIFLMFNAVKKYNEKKITPVIKKPTLPPHVHALNALQEIRHRKLWQEGKTKEYYSAIDYVLREYLEKIQPINALELTTEEIAFRLKKINIKKENKENLIQILKSSDMVKFAKDQPLPEENENTMNDAIAFINSTKPSLQTSTE